MALSIEIACPLNTVTEVPPGQLYIRGIIKTTLDDTEPPPPPGCYVLLAYKPVLGGQHYHCNRPAAKVVYDSPRHCVWRGAIDIPPDARVQFKVFAYLFPHDPAYVPCQDPPPGAMLHASTRTLTISTTAETTEC